MIWDHIRIYVNGVMSFIIQTTPQKNMVGFTTTASLKRSHNREELHIGDRSNVILIRLTDKNKLEYSHRQIEERSQEPIRVAVKNCREMYEVIKNHLPYCACIDWKDQAGKKVGAKSLRDILIEAEDQEVDVHGK